MMDTIGRYKVHEQIGTGGMGDVYRARDLQHGRLVAIKVLPRSIAGHAATRERFLADALTAAALSHPNVAQLYEIGDGDPLFVAFDFVPGETLEKTLGGGSISPRQAIDLAAELADALGEGHAQGVIHGDVSASNVIVTPTGHAKLIDYGLTAWTAAGGARRASDESADIFSLGALLFEMLTGEAPAAERAVAVAPSAINPSSPPELDVIVLKALDANSDRRYESASTMAAELRAVGAVLDVRSDATATDGAGAATPDTRLGTAAWITAAAILGGLALAWITWHR
jgi:serine/threonine-protein kinase